MVAEIAVAAMALIAMVQTTVIVVLVGRVADTRQPLTDEAPTFLQELKHLLPVDKPPKPSPLPQEVVDYCDKWMDEFAKNDCRSRARMHYSEMNDWNVVMTTIQREDGEIA